MTNWKGMRVHTGVTAQSIMVRNHFSAPSVTRHSCTENGMSKFGEEKLFLTSMDCEVTPMWTFIHSQVDILSEYLVTIGAVKWFLTSMDFVVTPVWTLMPSQVANLCECLVTIRADKWFFTSMDCAVTTVWTHMPSHIAIICESLITIKADKLVSHQYELHGAHCELPCPFKLQEWKIVWS